ncbi:MAG: DUF952 domain-containing protein [Myxococcales bacterium]|nr:DUF952 domain-containing protein [Myxococcales bacterium]
MRLFHITTAEAWERAKAAGEYRAPSLETEQFIHLSTDSQWIRTAQRFFRGQRGLVLLSIRLDRVKAEVKFERADGEDFPHLYGALNLDAVVEVFPLPVGDDGAILAPTRKPTEPQTAGH